jgi:hypothetical protein
MTVDEVKSEEKFEKVKKCEKFDAKCSKGKTDLGKESSRSETPPLKRLMRQDPLPLLDCWDIP